MPPYHTHFDDVLQRLDQNLLSDLFTQTVHALQAEIPGLGEVVAYDVKHICANVKENNPRVSMKDRYCKERQPTGNPDCRVGVKRSTNQQQHDGKKSEVKEYRLSLQHWRRGRHHARLWRCGDRGAHPAL